MRASGIDVYVDTEWNQRDETMATLTSNTETPLANRLTGAWQTAPRPERAWFTQLRRPFDDRKTIRRSIAS